MSTQTEPQATQKTVSWRNAGEIYRQVRQTPWPLALGLGAAQVVAQLFFFHTLHLGEFGWLNAALGAILCLVAPLFGLHLGLREEPFAEHERAAWSRVLESLGWVLAVLSGALCLGIGGGAGFPRWSLILAALPLLAALLLTPASAFLAREEGHRGTWSLLRGGAALLALTLSLLAARFGRGAEAVLLALAAGLVPLLRPALHQRELKFAGGAAWRQVIRSKRLARLAAFTGVALATALWAQTDRVAVAFWLGRAVDNDLGYVPLDRFDAYQAAGLAARGLLALLFPLLVLFYAERAPLRRTTWHSLRFGAVHLGLLILGATLLNLAAPLLARLFGGAPPAFFALTLRGVAVPIVLLGLLQSLGVFLLASRRGPEIIALVACAIGYFFMLYCFGQDVGTFPAYMFGASTISLSFVALIGLVRWGRRQP